MANVERIGDGIWLTNVALDEYEVRGALLVGSRMAAVWDTLSRPRDMAPFAQLIGDRDFSVIYSHADWDHIWGTAGLARAGAPIIAHAHARERFATDVPATLAGKRTAQPGAWDDVVLVPPSETFEIERSLDLGGMTLSLHHLPGHTPDCIVGLVAERGMLLAGDTVETPCPVVPPHCPLEAWIAGLRRWASDGRVRTVVPAHGAIAGREIVEQTAEYLDALLKGCPIEPRGPLTPFYRETHAQNLRVTLGKE